MKKIGYRFSCLLLLLITTAVHADRDQDSNQDRDFDSLVDFGDLNAISGGKEPSVEISLGGPLLGFLRRATEGEDEELANALSGLKSIQIKVFEIADGQYDNAREQVAKISKRLKANNWMPTVKVNSDDSIVQMYMQTKGDNVTGMTVMILEEDGEAVFINIVGEMDPDQLGRVADKFGVDLDDM